jgi:hypothetical protein
MSQPLTGFDARLKEVVTHRLINKARYEYLHKGVPKKKKDRPFAIKTLLLILQHFKHFPLQNSLLYRRYTVPNFSSTFGMLPGTHFL